ncbi:MAG TPA: HEPN domain-containing protein [Dongiaceae bacterium]|nr:HEPN domain-containing protein [Dongiaceae bacterium]
MTDEQTALVAKAEENIRAARTLMREGFAEIAASRAYYAMFYLAGAMLLERDLRFKTHAGLQGAFGREITQRGILPVELHSWLLDAAKSRNVSDYWTIRGVTRDEAATHIDRAERFLKEVGASLARSRDGES